MKEGPKEFDREVRVTFIRDEPATEDFFKTHGRVAHAVAAAIRSNPQLRIIGLLGHWGSGKSTVVHHLKDDLSSGPDAGVFHVFSYDAWLHQNDPVRRSFLESLYEHLLKGELIDEAKWKPLLEELTGYVEKSEVEQEPILTTDAKWIIGSLLPLPFAIGLMNLDTIREAWGDQGNGLGKFVFFLSIAIILLPLIVMAARKARNDLSVYSEEAAPFIPLLLNKTVEKTKSTTFRSPEPTSIEFGKAF